MKRIILVFGLSGSGKTKFSDNLKRIIFSGAKHINADEVRKEYNDWDFSEEGRKRQAIRMKELTEKAEEDVVILDFICPKKEYRKLISPNISFFMDTLKSCKYEDTNKVFERPDSDENCYIISAHPYNL